MKYKEAPVCGQMQIYPHKWQYPTRSGTIRSLPRAIPIETGYRGHGAFETVPCLKQVVPHPEMIGTRDRRWGWGWNGLLDGGSKGWRTDFVSPSPGIYRFDWHTAIVLESGILHDVLTFWWLMLARNLGDPSDLSYDPFVDPEFTSERDRITEIEAAAVGPVVKATIRQIRTYGTPAVHHHDTFPLRLSAIAELGRGERVTPMVLSGPENDTVMVAGEYDVYWGQFSYEKIG